MILLFLLLLLIGLTACQTAPSGCNINTGQIVQLPVPMPTPGLRNGDMANDLRDLIDEVKKDNVRKEGVIKQIREC